MSKEVSKIVNQIEVAKKNVAETRENLKNILVEGVCDNKLITVVVTGNREIKKINIHKDLLKVPKKLESSIIAAVNDAIKKADIINEEELASTVQKSMPFIF